MTEAPTVEGTHRLFAVYESWPPYLYASCFSGESFFHGSHLMFSWRLSFYGRSRGCLCQKFAIAGKTVESQSRGGDMSWPMPCEVRRNAVSHQLPLTHRALTVPRYQILRVLNRLIWYSYSKPEHPSVGDHSCTTGNRSRNLCYDSWSLSHLGYLYPGTTPVMIKLDHNRSCPWI